MHGNLKANQNQIHFKNFKNKYVYQKKKKKKKSTTNLTNLKTSPFMNIF